MSWSVYQDPTIRRDGFVLLGSVPEISPATLKRAVRRDGLIHALPGAYLLPECQNDLAVWLRLVCRRCPNAVVGGRAAWEAGCWTTSGPVWPRDHDRVIDVSDRINRPDRAPYRFWKREVPERHVVQRDGIRRVQPVFAAAELLATDDGAAACEFLRRSRSLAGSAGVAALGEAVTALARVPGHVERVRGLAELAAAPWSLLELHLHRLLRAAGITGWMANLPVRLGMCTVHVDVAFPDLRVAIEADGRQHHSSAADFELDRARWNQLAAEGWIVLRASWAMVHHESELIAQIRAALASRS